MTGAYAHPFFHFFEGRVHGGAPFPCPYPSSNCQPWGCFFELYLSKGRARFACDVIMLRILARGNLAGVPPDPPFGPQLSGLIDPRFARLAHFIRSMAKAMKEMQKDHSEDGNIQQTYESAPPVAEMLGSMVAQAKPIYEAYGLETASQQMGGLITAYIANALGFDPGELEELQAALTHLFQRQYEKTNEEV